MFLFIASEPKTRGTKKIIKIDQKWSIELKHTVKNLFDS